MDDCNLDMRQDVYNVFRRSDSSMDDCNLNRAIQSLRGRHVQIPLWTIVTMEQADKLDGITLFRFLYGRL